MTIIDKVLNRIRLAKKSRKTFSQCGEDIILDSLFEGCAVYNGTYMDIGANHPVKFNNTYRFYKNGWRGFNIDPLSDGIKAFNSIRSGDTNIAVGIGDTTGMRDFYQMLPSTLSTFNKDVAENYCCLGHSIKQIKPVQFLSVRDLISKYKIPRDLDLLSIDIEGGEFDVIKSLLQGGVLPKAMVCETIDYVPDMRSSRKNHDLIERIKGLGFWAYADTFINTVFVNKAFWDNEK